MKPYADYRFYNSEYGSFSIPEAKFQKAILSATQYIKYVTAGRSDQYAGEAIKFVACAVAELYAEIFGLADGCNSISQIKSENNDGYSVSYVTESLDGETREEFFKRKAYVVAQQWLQGTNLLNRRVGCHHVNQCEYDNL